VYAATGDGHVWVTTKADVTAPWKQHDSGLFATKKIGNVVDISVDPADPRQAFAVVGRSQRKNVWHLRHSGKVNDWVDISGDLPKNLTAVTIFVDWQYTVPALYLGTDRGVYHSVDLGTHWHKFGKFLPNTTVADLQHVPSLDILAGRHPGPGRMGDPDFLVARQRLRLRGRRRRRHPRPEREGDGRDRCLPRYPRQRCSGPPSTPSRPPMRAASTCSRKCRPAPTASARCCPTDTGRRLPAFARVTLGGSDVRQQDFGNRRDPTRVGPDYLTIATSRTCRGALPTSGFRRRTSSSHASIPDDAARTLWPEGRTDGLRFQAAGTPMTSNASRTTEGRGRLYDSIVDTIGNTPCIRVNRIAPKHVRMYVKAEFFNPAASVKDRLAISIIEGAERRGDLKPGRRSSRRRAATPASAWRWSVPPRAIRWSSRWPTRSRSSADA
jgi:hypothetical protein